MSDRELLEAAAKAAGMHYLVWTPGASPIVPPAHRADAARPGWNPLTDDGDALRLAVRLRIDVCWGHDMMYTQTTTAPTPMFREPFGADMAAATRRAIVRAAAAMTPNVRGNAAPTARGEL